MYREFEFKLLFNDYFRFYTYKCGVTMDQVVIFAIKQHKKYKIK